MTASPCVSVIIPTYNRTQFLRECLDSVAAQDVDSAEILIIDNASTDGTYDLCAEHAATDDRVRLIHRALTLQAPAPGTLSR